MRPLALETRKDGHEPCERCLPRPESEVERLAILRDQSNGIDAKLLSKCAASDEAKDLLAASFAYSASLGFGASPTLINNRVKVVGVKAEATKGHICAHNKLAGCDVPLNDGLRATGLRAMGFER